MEFFSNHWGSLFSVIGVVVSVIGLAWAIWEAHGARSAAEVAEQATVETRDSIGRHLVTIDLERAVSLIQRLKLLHDTSRWEAALEQYQVLRAIISDISARYPDLDPEISERLTTARRLIRLMEDYVGGRENNSLGTNERIQLNRSLNEIQSDIEDIASAMGLGE